MKKPIAVLVADCHVHPHKQFNTYNDAGESSRVSLTIDALKPAIDQAKGHGVPLICLGDLLHEKTSVPVEVIRPLQEAFEGVHGYLLVGNHERPDRFSNVHVLSWLETPTLKVIDTASVTQDALPGIDVYWLPWTADSEATQQALATLLTLAPPDRPRVLFGHGMVNGSVGDNGHPLVNPKMTPESLMCAYYNSVWFGDVHQHQKFAPNGHYVGALMPQNFGERNNPGGFVLLFEDLTWSRHPVPHPSWVYSEDPKAQASVVVAVDGNPEFSRPDPRAIAKEVMESEPNAPVSMDTTSLDSMLAAYVEANPLPDNVTFEEVKTRLLLCLGGNQ